MTNTTNDVIISIGDIRKCKNSWDFSFVQGTNNTINLIIDKLEEIDKRLDFIEQNMNKNKIVAENGWK